MILADLLEMQQDTESKSRFSDRCYGNGMVKTTYGYIFSLKDFRVHMLLEAKPMLMKLWRRIKQNQLNYPPDEAEQIREIRNIRTRVKFYVMHIPHKDDTKKV